MCPNSIFSRPTMAVLAAGMMALLARPVAAEDLRAPRAPAVSQAPSIFSGATLSAYAKSFLTPGYLTPAYGVGALGVSPSGLWSSRAVNGMSTGLGLARSLEVGGKFTMPVSIGRIGVFGAQAERPSLLTLTPSTSWNLGASFSYAGLYVRGGFNEAAAIGPLLGIQGIHAGMGYEFGDLDLRVTYLTLQATGAAEREIDGKQWSIGGIYNITSRIRLNADAFYGVGETRGTALSAQPPLTSPPGTGARVGVQLRF